MYSTMPRLISVSIIKTSGSWEGGETTWLKETKEAAAVAVDSAILGCLGRRTMGCWRAVGHKEMWHVSGRCWRGYEERSTQSCRPAGEAVEGLVCTADIGEAAAELGWSAAEPGWSAAEPGCSVAADLRTCTSGDGEPVPAQWSLERQAYGDNMAVWDGDAGVAESMGKVVWWGAVEGRIGLWLGLVW